ncbi:hypothetical protein [Vampirovibrio chlorellavorus]|uniref:hypothetical protein n=1 Tax=Vampirovibrio chlorellavorus TaxID=758823 RepID=UPI0026EC262F|nr:hypothetical protein [Vampirovibrio chlorellavorus]
MMKSHWAVYVVVWAVLMTAAPLGWAESGLRETMGRNRMETRVGNREALRATQRDAHLHRRQTRQVNRKLIKNTLEANRSPDLSRTEKRANMEAARKEAQANRLGTLAENKTQLESTRQTNKANRESTRSENKALLQSARKNRKKAE